MTSVDLTCDSEGFRGFAYCDRCGAQIRRTNGWYCDCPNVPGNITIGYGLNVSAGISRDDARVFVAQRQARDRLELQQRQPVFGRLDPVRQAAIVDCAYQMGVAGILGFVKMWAALDRQNWATAAAEARDSEWGRNPKFKTRVDRNCNMLLTGAWPE